ncbi:MAG: penicillin-binding protein 1C, partial [Myxococcota bacterium]
MGRRALSRVAVAVVTLAAATALVAAWAVPLPERLSVRSSPTVTWRDGEIAHAFLSPDERWRIDLTEGQLDEKYLDALIAAEDARFWWHPGVDPLAIVRAAGQNLAAGRVVSGGSTLTMQLARMLEPRPRTLVAKLADAARAIQLELRLSKSEILAAYVRLAPFGRNLEGVGAASLAYFGHSAGALTEGEIAVLLAVPQRPASRYPHPDNVAALRASRDRVAARLQADGAFSQTPEAIAAIEAAPVPDRLRPLPRDAAHAAWWLRGDGVVQTTLDADVQRVAERVLAEHATLAARMDVHDAAIVVIERETGEVAGLVGGVDFWSGLPGSQMPAFAAPRSPGSALKPVLYAAALDEGLILPGQLVTDTPVRYGQYQPKNYDGTYDGVVTMDDALSRSLNVPFINLLSEVGVERFLGRLRAMGARSLQPTPGHYGLSLIAGGIELTPLEMAGLYWTLAEQGTTRPLRLRPEQAEEPGISVFSPGAAWLTVRTLARRDRPDFPERAQVSATPRSVWWKTGTSFGNRDAWSIGSGQRYVVVVWLGNLDNRSSPWLVGARAAGPILFDLLEGLGDDRGAPPPRPSDLSPIEVCALSGHLPSARCPRRVRIDAPQKVPPSPCPYHQEVLLDAETGLRVTPGCQAGRPVRREVYVLWPPEVRRWLTDQHLTAGVAPPLAAGCAPSARGGGPQIRSPRAGEVAMLIPGLAADEQEIALEADAVDGAL